MKIVLKDGSVIECENSISAFELAKSISEGLARCMQNKWQNLRYE